MVVGTYISCRRPSDSAFCTQSDATRITTYPCPVEEIVEGWPFWLAFGLLFVAAVVRGAATYALGRGARSAAARRGPKGEPRPVVSRAESLVRRVGPPAVSLGFLTVGLQTAINLSAGALRMPLTHFGPALAVGAAMWATVYTTVGLAVVEAALGRVSWWWVLGTVLAVVVLVLVGRRLLRRAG